LSQDEFAAVGGLGRKSLSLYETDVRAPDTSYLLALRDIGVDAVYVLTGERMAPGVAGAEAQELSEDELEVLAGYRQLNDAGKAALSAFLASCINSGTTLTGGHSTRVKRLVENRRAALDERTAENVERAVAEIERVRAERVARKKK
jgi:transcriptional regulator with XRE-family HTH domain